MYYKYLKSFNEVNTTFRQSNSVDESFYKANLWRFLEETINDVVNVEFYDWVDDRKKLPLGINYKHEYNSLRKSRYIFKRSEKIIVKYITNGIRKLPRSDDKILKIKLVESLDKKQSKYILIDTYLDKNNCIQSIESNIYVCVDSRKSLVYNSTSHFVGLENKDLHSIIRKINSFFEINNCLSFQRKL